MTGAGFLLMADSVLAATMIRGFNVGLGLLAASQKLWVSLLIRFSHYPRHR